VAGDEHQFITDCVKLAGSDSEAAFMKAPPPLALVCEGEEKEAAPGSADRMAYTAVERHQ
jgi:hypothetical protein